MPRKQLLTPPPPAEGGKYFPNVGKPLRFIPTGCTLLNLALTGRYDGGWPLGRVSNPVGDKSTGKTLLGIEACANFARTFPKGKMNYQEAEAAFDLPFAATLGLPLDRVKMGEPLDTVEEFEVSLDAFLDDLKDCEGLYILDSLDALTSEKEEERQEARRKGKEVGGSYGMEKAKGMSSMFRHLTRKIERTNCHLMVISQVRANIGATFGRQVTRTGGKALDFYASHVLYLAHIGKINKTKGEITRAVGVHIKAQVDKNKVAAPFREAEFPIKFGYGIDDLEASTDWLKEIKRLDVLELKDTEVAGYLKKTRKLDLYEYNQEVERVAKIVGTVWKGIEDDFAPERGKYG